MGMLEVKEYIVVEVAFPLITAFVDRAPRYSDEPKLTTVRTTYSNLANYLTFKPCNIISPEMSSYDSIEEFQKLKAVAKGIVSNLENENPFTTKFCMVDHVPGNKSRFGLLSYVDAFPYKHFNIVNIPCMRVTSVRKISTLEETVKALNSLASRDDIKEVKFGSD